MKDGSGRAERVIGEGGREYRAKGMEATELKFGRPIVFSVILRS